MLQHACWYFTAVGRIIVPCSMRIITYTCDNYAFKGFEPLLRPTIINSFRFKVEITQKYIQSAYFIQGISNFYPKTIYIGMV